MTNAQALANASYDKARIDLDALESIALDNRIHDKAHDIAIRASLICDTQSEQNALAYLDAIARSTSRAFMSRVYDALESLDVFETH